MDTHEEGRGERDRNGDMERWQIGHNRIKGEGGVKARRDGELVGG